MLARPGASPQRQPGLPLGKGHIPTQTHDYYRTGKVTLFAALDYLHGKAIAHTAQTTPTGSAFTSQAPYATSTGSVPHLSWYLQSAFDDLLDEFHASQHPACGLEALESQHRAHPTSYPAVILFDDIVYGY